VPKATTTKKAAPAKKATAAVKKTTAVAKKAAPAKSAPAPSKTAVKKAAVTAKSTAKKVATKAAPVAKKVAAKATTKAAPVKKAAVKEVKKVEKAVEKKAAPVAKKVAAAKPSKEEAKAAIKTTLKSAEPAPKPKAATPPPKPAPVKPVLVIKPMSQAAIAKDPFLSQQQQALQAEKADYLAQAKSLRDEAEQMAADAEPGDTQFDEESGEGTTAAVDREHNLRLSQQAMATVEEIDRALEKMSKGIYGLCEHCGEPIAKPRLEALPFAALCVACKSGGLTRR
jgi:DnaK suppressor protein